MRIEITLTCQKCFSQIKHVIEKREYEDIARKTMMFAWRQHSKKTGHEHYLVNERDAS